MSRTVNLLCLANSIKYRGRCVAGIDLDTGDWIRPVADTEHGELWPQHHQLDEPGPRVLDVLRIELDGPRPLPHQPENWLVSSRPWLRRSVSGTALMQCLGSHLVRGPHLFGDSGHRRISQGTGQSAADASLALVDPEGLQWFIESRPSNSKRPRAHFALNNAFYDLPVTDPAWMPAFRALDHGLHRAADLSIGPARKLLLTISLGEEFEFDGYCYKLVAGLVPVPSR